MKLTVAIPSYNKEKYIDRCIRSILVEKDYIDEIILIDNCSTDGTLKLAQKYEPSIKCVKNSSNLGMAGNFNRCVDLCKTDLLMIFHADDELIPGAIKRYLEFFETHPNIGLAHANFFYVRNGDFAAKQYMRMENDKKIRKAGLEALSMQGNACSTVIVKKSVYDEVGHFMESMSSDFEMWRRIGSKYDIGHLDMPTVFVHINPEQTEIADLKNMEVREIVKDWERLGEQIISHYPAELRAFQKKESWKGMVDGLSRAVAVNVKVGQYKKALQALGLICFKYKGFFRFLARVCDYLKYRYRLLKRI